MLRPIARLVGALLIASLPLPALAHPLSPSLLQVEEIDGGAARVTWKTPVLRVPGSDLRRAYERTGSKRISTRRLSARPESVSLLATG